MQKPQQSSPHRAAPGYRGGELKTQLQKSLAARLTWIVFGWACFALGVIGAFLPLLPTVPLMLLAAFCFARGSDRLHQWLIEHPNFGGPIRDWIEHRAIGRDAKRWALVAISASFLVSYLLDFGWHTLAVQAVTLGAVTAFILTRPTAP